MNPPIPGTVVIYGPHYARWGYGFIARLWALALHAAGVNVRVVPVDCNDPETTGGLDDTDWHLLRSLEQTPITPPVTAIFAYVPIFSWAKMVLPEPNLRILLTTFDSGANALSPPFRWIYMGNQMDQVWLANHNEEQAWIRAGLEPQRIHSFKFPHNWIDNPLLDPTQPKAARGQPFRFFHVSLFIPRRRLDVLVRAFLEEFPSRGQAELYLKMTYPRHPGGGKPKRDLKQMLDRLRRQTGSKAEVIVDDKLGTRLGMARLMDSCDVYVSADTNATAPVGEAIVRHRPVIITDGWGVDLPPEAYVVPNSTEQIPITPEMAEYMPHHRQTSFPGLDVGLMRQALRKLFEMPVEEHQAMARAGYDYIRQRYSYEATTPAAIAAIKQGWADRQRAAIELQTRAPAQATPAPKDSASRSLNIHWGGFQLFHGKIPLANREICLELMRRGHTLSLSPANGPFQIEELELKDSEKHLQLAARFFEPIRGVADFNVCSRWHPAFVEKPSARQVLFNTWWSGTIPVEWVKPISEYVDEVWVPSKFVRDHFAAVEGPPVRVLPFGFDPAVFWPGATPARLKTKKRFKFLFVGEASPRKGFDSVLLAYLKTFTAQDDVCLVVKDMSCEDYYVSRAGRDAIRQCQSQSRSPEIEYLDSMIGETDLAGLYTACDCFVQPFRTSSFGMAILEAMACGLPVITTNYGGVLDFCDAKTAWLLPAREVKQRPKFVGHWRVDGEQRHAEISISDLQERLRHAARRPSEAPVLAGAARERVHAQFTWPRIVDQVVARFEAIQKAPARCSTTRPAALPNQTKSSSAPIAQAKPDGTTIVVFAPFYNRSGYGVSARALVTALHAVGSRVRIVPVDNVEEGIDDCDLALLKTLEDTPVTLPVVAIFFHVPSANWLKVQLPPQSVRVMYTTFDSSAQGNLPPADWISVCKQMDQVWLSTSKEAAIFATAGVPESKLKVVHCPHPWVNNPLLPLPSLASAPQNERFRFLSIAMFLPRRRWDTLIEAYLAEFKDTPKVELCLKVNFPSWHPLPGQPQHDLRKLIEQLRARTGSQATIILDETLGTRQGICRLIDSCDTYVSTDTTATAPIGEAFTRGKIVILPDGYGVTWPYCEAALVIPVDQKLCRPMTPQELLYQPHHRDTQMPLLRVEDVRRTMRAAFELPADQRQQMGHCASLVIENSYGLKIVSVMLKALEVCLTEKFTPQVRTEPAQASGRAPNRPFARIGWEGSFLDFGSLSYVNRELTRALACQPGVELHRIGQQTLTGVPAASPEFQKLAKSLSATTPAETQVTVRHAWPPDWRRPRSGALVMIQPWEYGALPIEWVQNSRHVDEFWVPSAYVRNVYVSSGVPEAKVKVVPNGIDPERFQPGAKPIALPTGKRFKFLFVGGTIHRKGPDVLLQAYMESFTAQDDVCLVIKDFGGQSVYAGQTLEPAIEAARRRPDAPEIVHLTEEIAAENMAGLYTACDCLVHPYRGEGFGLPVLEAMACGLPVVVTTGGAADDFAREEYAYHIPGTRKGLGDSISGLKLTGPGWLLEPDAAALSARMKWIVNHPDEAQAKGQAASEYARREWTWERAAKLAAARAHELAEGVAVSHPNAAKALHQPQAKSAPVTLPPCALVGHLGKARQLMTHKNSRQAWETTLAALQVRPFHPEAYLLLAEIAQVVGDGDSARLCAEHARTLAPGCKSIRQFLNRRLKGDNRPAWLVVPEEVQKPGPKVQGPKSIVRGRLSVGLITKNEEKFLRHCLTSIQGLADQIVVVDTGSTDRTIEIAKEQGAEVYQFAWCDDFSAARNAVLEHVTGDWVLMLDADEELSADGKEKLLRHLQEPAVMAWRVPIVDIGREAQGCSYVPRLFRNAPALFYVGRVHEQVFSSIEVRRSEWGLENRLGEATLIHHGYTAELTRDRNKVERNLRLLERAIEEMPGEPHLLMNLGLELARSGREAEALPRYQQAFEAMVSKPSAEITPELRETLLAQYCTRLASVKDFDEIARVLTAPKAKPAGGLNASLHFALGLALMERGRNREAAESFQQCLVKRNQPSLTPINKDILTAAPHHCLALAQARLGNAAGAEKTFQDGMKETGYQETLRLDYARFLAEQNRPVDALHRLHEVVSENSGTAAAWRLGGEIALSRPEFLEFARDWTSEAIQHLPQDGTILAQRGEALLLSQDAGGAREFWERLWSQEPQPTALAALMFCELAEGPLQHAPQSEADAAEVSRAFIAWYRKCLTAGAEQLIVQVNSRVSELRQTLPQAFRLLESVVAETDRNQTPEPCAA